MENQQLDPLGPKSMPKRDIVALLTMLDYLIAEISKIDLMSAQCLIMARKSLAEVVADALVKTH